MNSSKPDSKDQRGLTQGNVPVPDPAPSQPEKMVTGKDRNKRLLRVGMFSLIGFLILIIGVFVIGDKQNLFSSTFSIFAEFRTVGGLKSGALVTINGIKVGTVSNVELMIDTASYVRVDMVIDNDAQRFVRTSTVATISQQGIIGDKLIELKVSDANAPLLTDGTQITSVEPTNYEALLEDAQGAVRNSQNITASLDTLFLRFRRGEGTLGKFLTDDEAYLALVRVTGATERLLSETNAQLASVTGTLNSAASNVNSITVEGQKLVADIGSGKGTLGALLYNRSLYDSLEALTGTLNEAAGSAGFAAREFGLNMRGLRSNWLVGGLFAGSEEEDRNAELLAKELEIRMEELRQRQELLEERERQLMQREGRGTEKRSER